MDALNIDKNLLKDLKPLYIVMGEDSYLRKKALNAFNKLVDGFAKDFNISYFNGVENFEDLEMALNTPPLMGSVRLVFWVSDFKKCPASVETKMQKDLKRYLISPSPTSILVIVDNQKYFTSVYNLGENVNCKRLIISELLNFISVEVSKNGFIINNGALNELIIRCNCYIEAILSELSKLYLLCEKDKIITMFHINEVVANTTEYSVHKLTDALGSGNNEQALKVVNSLLERGEKPIELIGLLTAYFRLIFYAKISGLKDYELAEKMKVKLYPVTKAMSLAPKFNAKELKANLEFLYDLDYKCKRGLLSFNDAINVAMCKLINKRR